MRTPMLVSVPAVELLQLHGGELHDRAQHYVIRGRHKGRNAGRAAVYTPHRGSQAEVVVRVLGDSRDGGESGVLGRGSGCAAIRLAGARRRRR